MDDFAWRYTSMAVASGMLVPDTGGEYDGPGNGIDQPGATWLDNARLLVDWVLQLGDETRIYGQDDPRTVDRRRTLGAEQMRQAYAAGGYKSGAGSYSTIAAALESMSNPLNATQVQVGAFRYEYTNNGDDGTVTYTIRNELTVNSFFYHLPERIPGWSHNPERWKDTTFMGTFHQVFIWTEPNPVPR